MICSKLTNDKTVSSRSCPEMYCPPNPDRPEYSNFTASTCTYFQTKNSYTNAITSNFNCNKRDYCNLNCWLVLNDVNDFQRNYTSDNAIVEGATSISCRPGNWTGKQNCVPEIISAFGAAENSASNLSVNVSFLLHFILIGILFLVLMKKTL